MADKYNPRYPDVIGDEWDALVGQFVPLSTNTQTGIQLTAEVTETVALGSIYLNKYTGTRFSNYVMAEVVEAGKELQIGHVGQTLCAVNGGSTTGDTGGFTVAECLADPGDAPDIELTVTGPPETIDMQFDTAGRFTGKRILKVELLYLFTGFSQDYNPESGWPAPTMDIRWFEGASVHNTISAPGGFTNLITPVSVASFGEFNDNPVPACFRPWTVQDLEDLDTGTQIVQMSPQVDSTFAPTIPTTFFVHYAALQVTWCEENRVAIGGVGLYDYTNGFNVVDYFQPDGTPGWPKVAGQRYSMLFSIPSLGSSYGRVFNDSDKADQVAQVVVGPMPHIDSLETQPLPTPSGIVVNRNADGAPINVVENTSLFPLVMLNLSGLITDDSHSYTVPMIGPVSVAHSSSQTIERPPSSMSYSWITFVARPLEVNGASLVATVQGQTATLTVDDYDAAETLAEQPGEEAWKRFTLPLTAPIAVTGSPPGVINVAFSSTASGEWWEVLGSAQGSIVTGSFSETYAGNTGIATVDGVSTGDLSVRLHTAAPQITGAGIGVLSQPVTGADSYCGVAQRCRPTQIDYARISWSSIPATGVGVTGFAYYEVQRQDDVDTDWLTVGHVEDRETTTFDDYEARVGVATRWRIRVHREDGIDGAWSATVTATISPSSANAPPGTLWFTSNQSPLLNVVYTEVYGETPNVEVQFVETDNRVVHQLTGRDYSFVQHPTERRGVRFTRPLLVNSLATPTVANRGDAQFNPLRDIAWAAIPYVCVRDDEGNRWFMNLAVPSGTIRRKGQIYIAQVSMIEVTDEPTPARICEDS